MTSSKTKLKRSRPLLGTYVQIELHGDAPAEEMNAWITAGFEAVAEVDRLMSPHRPDSDLSRLNRADPGAWVDVHPVTASVLRASNEFFKVSGGTFDIRCARPGSRKPPVDVQGARTRKTGPWTMDLGGIAKGFAVDRAVEEIRKRGRGRLSLGIVNAGGDLRRWGPGAPAVAVATSAVRTPDVRDRLSPAVHLRMPQGKALTKKKAVAVLSRCCLWSDALTKILLLGPKNVAKRCLARYRARGLKL